MSSSLSSSERSLAPVLCFLGGFGAIVMVYSVYSHLQTHTTLYATANKQQNNEQQQPKKKIQDAIQLKALAYLTQSTDIVMSSR
ncbi:hypothetical protein BDF14DRAFT_779063 [Spinellus fusiger]|nr:hypothetical protein BDF14DRAFT_779063 [Spinellus fusiger]